MKIQTWGRGREAQPSRAATGARQNGKRRAAGGLVLLLLLAAACSADDGSIGAAAHRSSSTPSDAPALNDDTGVSATGSDTVVEGVSAQAGEVHDRSVLPYPAPPYGSSLRSTIANFEFFGWNSPLAANFKSDQAGTISFADYYDPDGTKGYEVMYVSAVATWCSACQLEYRTLEANNLAKEFAARGVVFFGTLFENQDANPPTLRDLEVWAEAFDVAFPFGSDPALKLGPFFQRQATPLNMIVDLRTMKIIYLQTGFSEAVFEQLDAFLTDRGR